MQFLQPLVASYGTQSSGIYSVCAIHHVFPQISTQRKQRPSVSNVQASSKIYLVTPCAGGGLLDRQSLKILSLGTLGFERLNQGREIWRVL